MDEKPKPCDEGVAQARADIACGCPKYFYGARGSWAADMESTLKQEFGVELSVTSCFIWDDLVQFRLGYNRTIETVECGHGAGSLQKALDGVQERRKAAYDKWAAENQPDR